MKKLLAIAAVIALALPSGFAQAQTSLPGAAQGTDISGQATRAASDAASKASEKAVNDARQDKARAEAEQKAAAEAQKAAPPVK